MLELFSRIAPTYDLLNHLLSLNLDRRWRRALADKVRTRAVTQAETSGDSQGEVPMGASPVARIPALRILDACTGTADLALALAEKIPSARVVGLDCSEEMLRRARRKIRRRHLSQRLRLVRGDVCRLPYGKGSFDVVSMAFGLRNLTDPRKGLAEAVWVLKPGGQLLILEFSPPSRSLWGRLMRFYLAGIIPRLGGLISGSSGAYRYLFTSIAAFYEPRQVRSLMQEAGLGGIRVHRLTGGIAVLYEGQRSAAR